MCCFELPFHLSSFRSSTGKSHHRRTPSNSSATTGYPPGGSRGVNSLPPDPSAVEGTDLWTPASGTHDGGHYPRKYSRQSSYTAPTSLDLERPQTLELPMTPRTPLRSSLRKNSSYTHRYNVGGGSSGGTPTNPTPPDSLSEEVSGGGVMGPLGASRSDSGFVSTSNRVRFSPSPFEKGSLTGGAYVTDWSPTHEPPLVPAPPHRAPTVQKSPFPMQRHNRGTSKQPPSTAAQHYITESDLQRDFDLYPQT